MLYRLKRIEAINLECNISSRTVLMVWCKSWAHQFSQVRVHCDYRLFQFFFCTLHFATQNTHWFVVWAFMLFVYFVYQSKLALKPLSYDMNLFTHTHTYGFNTFHSKEEEKKIDRKILMSRKSSSNEMCDGSVFFFLSLFVLLLFFTVSLSLSDSSKCIMNRIIFTWENRKCNSIRY